jgi:catechol 2,3-dioxygenase-like lactoylglutathione lyase family enzyme
MSNWKLADIHHLGLTVSDIEQSIQFYRDVLGMTLIRRRPSVTADYVSQQTGYDNVELNVASFQISPNSKQSLEVVQYMNHVGEPNESATNQAGSSHLCLLVDDLKACYVDLSAKGVRFKSEPVTITAGPNQGGLVLYFSDPDGYMLELFQPPA